MRFGLTYVLFLTITIPFGILAQGFNEITGINGDFTVVEYAEEHNVMFVGGDELYISSDDGLSWLQVNNGVGFPLEGKIVYAAAASSPSDYCIIAEDAMQKYIFTSSDAGVTWTQQYLVGASAYPDGNILDANGSTVIMAQSGGIFRSTDSGVSWTSNNFLTPFTSATNIIYNNQSQQWYLATQQDGIFISNDDGLTWSSIAPGINGGAVASFSCFNNDVMITTVENDQCIHYMLAGSGSLDNIIEYPRAALAGTSNPFSDNAGLTPSGDVLAESEEAFYFVDTLTENVFHYTLPQYQQYAEAGMDLGASQGIAFISGSSNDAAYLIDYLQSPDDEIPANFEIVNDSSACAGDNIEVSIYNTAADSVRWYVDNQFFTNGNTASIPTIPNTYASYEIRCEAYLDGFSTDQTKTKTFSPPVAPDSFYLGVDTNVCYDSDVLIEFGGYNSNSGNTTIEMYYNGNMVLPTQWLVSSLTSTVITNISGSDSLMIITKNVAACNNTSDTTYQYIQVGPDLIDFAWSSSDTAVCWNEAIDYQLSNTNSLYEYSISTEFSTHGNYQFNVQDQYGSTNPINYTTNAISWSSYTTQQSTLDPIFSYLNVQVEDNNGCIQTQTIDSVRHFRPTSFFRIHDQSYEVGTTAEISNYIPVGNRSWTSNSLLPGDLTQTSDTIPELNSSVPGFHDLMLYNEPYQGCTDSSTKYVQYAERSMDVDNCDVKSAASNKRVLENMLDQEGNLYTIGVNASGYGTVYGDAYRIERYSGTDSLLWSLEADLLQMGTNVHSAVIQAIDINAEGDVICAGWLSYSSNTYDDGILSTDPTNGNAVNMFVFKLDGDDGSLMWTRNINDMPIFYPNNNDPIIRPTDVEEHNDSIYVSISTHSSIQFLVLDSLGNYIDHEYQQLGTGAYDFFIQTHLRNYYINNKSNTFRSPRIKVLSNGDVLAIGRFNNFTPVFYPQLDLANTGQTGVFAMKYNINDGIFDVATIGKLGYEDITPNGTESDYSSNEPIYFDIDENDNIYVAAEMRGHYFPNNDIISILDSNLLRMPQSFLFKMNAEYNLEWITCGTLSIINGISYNEKSKDVLISGLTNESVGYSSDSVHLFAGDSVDVVHDSTLNNAQYYQMRDFHISKFDTLGNPLSIEVFDSYGGFVNTGYLTLEAPLSSSPCGDYVLNLPVRTPNWVIDSDTLVADTVLIVTGGSSGCSFDCKYMVPQDTLRLCGTPDSIFVHLEDYYGLDSVSYTIVSGGTPVYVGYAQRQGTILSLDFPEQQVMNGEFIVSYDNLVTQSNTLGYYDIQPQLSFADTICEEEVLSVTFTDSDFAYLFDNTISMIPTSFDIPLSEQSLGINSFPMTMTHYDSTVCYDTIRYFVQEGPFDAVYNFDTPICDGDDLIIEANDNGGYSYDWIQSGDTGNTTTFNDSEYSLGINEVIVAVTNAQGCEVFDTLLVTVEDCANINSQKKLDVMIFPNPSNGDFTILLDNNLDINEISLFDSKGRVIETFSSKQKSEVKVDLELLPGTYYLQFESKQGVKRKSIVIK